MHPRPARDGRHDRGAPAECETQNGRRGWLHVWLIEAFATYRVQPADAFNPLHAQTGAAQAGAIQAFFDGSANPGLRIGSALRILSTEELQ